MNGFQIGTIFIPEPSHGVEDTRSPAQKLHETEELLRVWRDGIMKFTAEKRAEIATLKGALKGCVDTWEDAGPGGADDQVQRAINHAKSVLSKTTET